MVESLVSHQGYNEDAKGDLQAFQERACWVENQAAVTISLPCTPSTICPTGWDGCGSVMRYFVPPFCRVDHCLFPTVSLCPNRKVRPLSPQRETREQLYRIFTGV